MLLRWPPVRAGADQREWSAALDQIDRPHKLQHAAPVAHDRVGHDVHIAVELADDSVAPPLLLLPAGGDDVAQATLAGGTAAGSGRLAHAGMMHDSAAP